MGRALGGRHARTNHLGRAPPRERTPARCRSALPAALANWLGVPVVGDLRGADVALGGQGAPIVPFAHWFFTPRRDTPRLVVNSGGICLFTYVPEREAEVLAYDVGPGMMLSDAFASLSTGGRLAFDRDGVLSRPGVVVEAVVRDVLAHPFVRRRPPKSTGREAFWATLLRAPFSQASSRGSQRHGPNPSAATARVLSLTASRDRRIQGLREIVLSGGGAENPVLVAEVTRCFPETHVAVVTSGVFCASVSRTSRHGSHRSTHVVEIAVVAPRGDGRLTARHLGGHVAWPSR